MYRQFAPDLIVISRFLSNGLEAVARGDDVSVRTGVLLVDVAAESLLKLVLRHYGHPVNPRSALPDIIKAVGVLPANHPGKYAFVSDLAALRNMRNCVMHDGTSQSVHAARALTEKARETLLRLARDDFGCNLINLRVDEFIVDPDIRRFLGQGWKAHEEGRYSEAAGIGALVYDELMRSWAKFNTVVFRLKDKVDGPLAEVAATLSSGIHLPDVVRFRKATESLSPMRSVSGVFHLTDWGWGMRRSQEQQASDARLALDFAGGFALQIEGRTGVPTGPQPSPGDD